jgi:hypothetical protein
MYYQVSEKQVVEEKPARSKGVRVFVYITCVFIVLIISCLILNAIVSKRINASLQQLTSGMNLKYSSVHANLINSSITIDSLSLASPADSNSKSPNRLNVGQVTISGINFFKLLSSKKLLINKLKLEKCDIDLDNLLSNKKYLQPDIHAPFDSIWVNQVELTDINGLIHAGQHQQISFEGELLLDSVKINDFKKSFDENNVRFAAIRWHASSVQYTVPESYTSIHIKNLDLDSRKNSMHIDSARIVPTLNKFDVGKKKGHQVDYIEGTGAGIDMEKLDVKQLFQKKLVADKITISHSNIYVFRDRRLPLKQDTKSLPVDDLKKLPMSIRVQTLAINGTNFLYEEFPKDGKQTGKLRIEHLRASVSPLINQPTKDDPAYMMVKSEGSLMGSGIVKASMKFPLRHDSSYVVEGVFRNLDLTTLNSSAENLGKIHIESGMLNDLSFQFAMNGDKSTGKIIGEYHNLVIDKLKDKSEEKKVAKFKTFFLKNLIIPKNKDKSLAESKRTGKVSYKRDPNRYFSYYLLHSLLTGVKSSFTLGFLLPG